MLCSTRLGLCGLLLLAMLGAMVAPRAQAQVTAARTDVVAPPASAHAVSTRASAGSRRGELVVALAAGARGLSADFLQAARAQAVGPARRGIQVLAVPAGFEEQAAQILAADPRVESAAPNFVRTADSHDPSESGWGVELLNAPDRWHADQTVQGDGVRVAVVDSGVDALHPQLAGRVVGGFDAYGTQGQDNCGHGTAVAGVVGAALDGVSTAGVAPRVTIVAVKVLEYDEFFSACTGDDADIARGILWAADPDGGRADIINLSLSGPQTSDVLRDAIAEATRRGAMVVGAAGNRGDRTPMYPAAYPDVISVGGLQRDGDVAAWWPQSNFGSVDVVAPARDIPLLLATRVPLERIGRSCRINKTRGMCSDGTSFAAPHVAGLAALLHQEHPELASLSGPQRVARLRQWVLGTARDMAATQSRRGVDLETGQGVPDAAAAAVVSKDPTKTLVTWRGGPRIVSPWARLLAAPSALPLTAMVTDGTGKPIDGAAVTFEAASGAQIDATAAVTDGAGTATTTLTSTDQGRRVRVTARVANHILGLQAYVLQRDDNIPGIKAPSTRFRGRLAVDIDPDDVFRFGLRAGETLRGRLRGVEAGRESVDMYVHHSRSTNVSDPEFAPLREDTAAFAADPLRLKVTAPSDAVRYLDLFGYGTYRIRWWIYSPGKVRRAYASPAEFTPNGDGRADVTRIGWRQTRRGDVTVELRDSDGRLVRTALLGSRGKGDRVYRWDGRMGGGLLAPPGSYRATVRWDNTRGRICTTVTRVRVAG